MNSRNNLENRENTKEVWTASFTEKLQIEDVPWVRLTTPYDRAHEFKQYLRDIQKKDLGVIKRTMNEISSNVEHQSTLWAVTPFAMVFLVRSFREIILEEKPDECAKYLAEQLLSLFVVVADACQVLEEVEGEEPLPAFEDMLKEEYLWPEEYTEEEDEIRFEEELYPDQLFYSFYYYSFEELKKLKPFLSQVKNEQLKETLSDELKELQDYLQ